MALPTAFDALIVDDGSPDGTATVVKNLQITYPERLFLIERSGKQGLGTAYITGFKWGLVKGYTFLFEMDCDFSHNPNDLVRMHAILAADQADVVVGSRYVKGGRCVNWPVDRMILSIGASIYVRLITWMWIKDPTAGFVGYKALVLRTIALEKIKFIGYAFQIEMKFVSWLLGFRLREIPITFTDRIEGSSKMSKGIVKEAIFGVLAMKWKSFFGNFRKVERDELLAYTPSEEKLP